MWNQKNNYITIYLCTFTVASDPRHVILHLFSRQGGDDRRNRIQEEKESVVHVVLHVVHVQIVGIRAEGILQPKGWPGFPRVLLWFS